MKLSDGYFQKPLDNRVHGPRFEALLDHEWSRLEQALGAVVAQAERDYLGGVFQSAHHANLGKSKGSRISEILRRMRTVEAAVIKMLDALDYPGYANLAEDGSALLDVPPDLMPGASADAEVWRAMVNAARQGDPETQDTVWSISEPDRFLHDLWLWGYTARQIRLRWKDSGGRPASVDQFVLRHCRACLTEVGVGFGYTSDPDMAGPAWRFILELRDLRPTVVTGSDETLAKYLRHARTRRPKGTKVTG